MKIEKDGMTVEDTMDNLIETETGVTCGCENPNLITQWHADGAKTYSYGFVCDCGNAITMTCERDAEDMGYWEDNDNG